MASDLTKNEQGSVLAAVRFLLVRCGSRETLAKALRYEVGTVRHTIAGRIPISPTMAFRVARLAQVGIDDLLAGKYPVKGMCPHCGHVAD
jgi:plasmid maintenance system antidote protein VapI